MWSPSVPKCIYFVMCVLVFLNVHTLLWESQVCQNVYTLLWRIQVFQNVDTLLWGTKYFKTYIFSCGGSKCFQNVHTLLLRVQVFRNVNTLLRNDPRVQRHKHNHFYSEFLTDAIHHFIWFRMSDSNCKESIWWIRGRGP